MTWKCVNLKGPTQDASITTAVFESGLVLIWKIVVWSERRAGKKEEKTIKNCPSNFMFSNN